MSELSNKEAISYIRSAAKSVGLTFKQSSTRLNGALLWKLVVRGGGETVMSNYLLSSALNDACRGYIQSWNGQRFEGINGEN